MCTFKVEVKVNRHIRSIHFTRGTCPSINVPDISSAAERHVQFKGTVHKIFCRQGKFPRFLTNTFLSRSQDVAIFYFQTFSKVRQ